MKVYVSADIEGTTGIASWDEAQIGKPGYAEFREQMTAEVRAACEGLLEAGATEVLVKDAHDSGRNLLVHKLPEAVRISRGWSGHPFCMVDGLDASFSAAVFTGYHSRSGSGTNPLAHSMATELGGIRLNGRWASEFLLNAYAAALVGVPVIFVSGDQGLCDEVRELNSEITVQPVMRGVGDATLSIHPQVAIKSIKEGVRQALGGDLSRCRLALPDHFHLELEYHRHAAAYKASFYPGARLAGPHLVEFDTDAYFEVLRLLTFVIF